MRLPRSIPALLSLAMLAGPALADETRFVPSGVNQQIDFFASVSPDCSSPGLPVVRLIDGPYRGLITTDKGRDFLPFPASNVRHACNRKRVAGTKLFYKSPPHLIGTDHVRLLILSGAGAGREAAYDIQVR